MAVATHLMSVEEFERLPDDGQLHELDEGVLVSMPPPSFEHGEIQGAVLAVLRNFAKPRKLGSAATEAGFLLSPGTVRAPDVSFLRADRLPHIDRRLRIRGAPDLAVEIVSPSDSAADIAHKVRQYLEAGCAIVWVIYPRDREIHAFGPAGRFRVLRSADLLEAPEILPGFSVPIESLFE